MKWWMIALNILLPFLIGFAFAQWLIIPLITQAAK
jgi:hypothetical protein